MEGRQTFLHLHGGFKRDVGEGQRLGSTVIPCTAGNGRAERGLALLLRLLHAAEKSPVGTACSSVPKPTQVEWYKDTKARERNLVKELGTLTP